jgi:DNA-binding transcriptional LysR family regulator
MTLEQLRIFVEVASREHVTRAAEVLNLTQSAVSAAISALEMRHGVILFDRVGRRIALTEAGRLFVDEARGVLERARAAELALADLGGSAAGVLRIHASQTVASYWLPSRLVSARGSEAHRRQYTERGGSGRRRCRRSCRRGGRDRDPRTDALARRP